MAISTASQKVDGKKFRKNHDEIDWSKKPAKGTDEKESPQSKTSQTNDRK